MKLSQIYNHEFKGKNTEMVCTVEYNPKEREVVNVTSINIVVNNVVVAEISNILNDFFDEVIDKIVEDLKWHEIASDFTIG